MYAFSHTGTITGPPQYAFVCSKIFLSHRLLAAHPGPGASTMETICMEIGTVQATLVQSTHRALANETKSRANIGVPASVIDTECFERAAC